MFTIKGNVVEVLADQKIANSTMRAFVITTAGEKPKRLKFDLWNEKVTLIDDNFVGNVVEVGFDAESKEFNGKYYTNLRAYSVSSEVEISKEKPAKKTKVAKPDDDFDDLPF